MNGKLLKQLVTIVTFVGYLSLVCYVLFINEGSNKRSTYYKNPNDHFIPFQGTIDLIKLAQQYNFQGYYLKLLILNVVGNFILLLPFGFLGPLVIKPVSTLAKVTFFALVVSLSAEFIQYIFSIGIFDVDDILYNIIGAGVGFALLKKVRNNKQKFSTPKEQFKAL